VKTNPMRLVGNLLLKAPILQAPYSGTVIGSMADLNAASLDDVKDWFKSYYGPNNAVLVIAGDIDVKTAFEKVNKYSGDISPGTPVAKHDEWISKISGIHWRICKTRLFHFFIMVK
jgi:zinc protease